MRVTAIISLELSQFPYMYDPVTISVVTCKSRLKNSKWFLANSKQFLGFKKPRVYIWFHSQDISDIVMISLFLVFPIYFCSKFQFLLDFSSTLNLLQDFWGLRELEAWAWPSLTLVFITYILNSSLRATRYYIYIIYIIYIYNRQHIFQLIQFHGHSYSAFFLILFF